MRHDTSAMPEAPERKERLFLPTFPLKSSLLSANQKKRSRNISASNSKSILSPEDLKLLCEKIDHKKNLSMPPLTNNKFIRNPIKMRTFRFSKLSTPASQAYSPVPIKPIYYSKIFNKRNNEKVSEPYKFMLTGANFTYLNSRILEKDSSTHSIPEAPRLDARYSRQHSPELRRIESPGVYYMTSHGFVNKDYNKRRVVFKNIKLIN